MCTSPLSPPCSAVISSQLPNSRELIPAGADSVYIQRCSDKPYQPAQLKRSRARKEGLAPAQCQPLWAARVFSCLFFFSLGALLRARSCQNLPTGEGGCGGVYTVKPGAPGSYPGADNREEEGRCPSSWWESASSVSQGSSCCATPRPWQHFLLPAPLGWGFTGISIALLKTALQLLHILFLNLSLQLYFCLTLTVTSWPCPELSPGARRIQTHGADVSPLIPHQHWGGGAIIPQLVTGTGQEHWTLGPVVWMEGLSWRWSMASGLGAHPVPCLSYQIPPSLHLPAHRTSLGPARCFLRAGSPSAPLGKGWLLESSIPRLGPLGTGWV